MAGRSAAPLALALGVGTLFLAATLDERTLGAIADEQQILSSAVAVARLGEIGIARGQLLTVTRPGGDAVPVYGMGLPLVQAPVVRVASAFERRFGSRSSQTLLAALQLVLVVLAAALAGLLARTLGASPRGEAVAAAATLVSSPLGTYAGTALTEPLQALCLVAALLLAARSARTAVPRALALAAAAGLAAGYAVLTKGVNLAVAPFTLAPLLLDLAPDDPSAGSALRARLRRLLAAAAGAAGPVAAWLVLELVRFGRPFGSHAGHGFGHPPLDGLWRVLAGGGQGLLLVFPLALLAPWGVARLARGRQTRGSAAGIALPSLALLAIASTYWAWDGWSGWGPRYLVPAVPLLAAAAALAPGRLAGGLGVAAAVAGLPVTLLGLLQPDASASYYVASTGDVTVPEAEARRIPPPFLKRGPAGEARVTRLYTAPSDPAFDAFRVHLFLLRTRLAPVDAAERRRLLEAPPWLATHPGAVPGLDAPPQTAFGVVVANLTGPFRWPFLGRALVVPDSERQATFLGSYDLALADQVTRALDTGALAAAASLARELHEVAPSGWSTALFAESLRLSGRTREMGRFLDAQPRDRRGSPFVKLVEALAQRDAGMRDDAREALDALARAFPAGVREHALADPGGGSAPGLTQLVREATTGL